MKKVLLLSVLFSFAVGLTNSVFAQKGKSVKATKNVVLKGNEVTKERGDNSKIITPCPTTDNPVAKPDKQRGGDPCAVYFDNYTGYYVEIYIDGNYQGTMAPWSDLTRVVEGGYTTIYCITTGRTRDWSAAGSCHDVYRYKIQ